MTPREQARAEAQAMFASLAGGGGLGDAQAIGALQPETHEPVREAGAAVGLDGKAESLVVRGVDRDVDADLVAPVLGHSGHKSADEVVGQESSAAALVSCVPRVYHDGVKRKCRIDLRVTADELRRITETARRLGISVSALLRMRALEAA